MIAHLYGSYQNQHIEDDLTYIAPNNADSTVHKWLKDAKNNNGTINSRSSGNYASDKAKEIARLKKELKDTQNTLEILKRLHTRQITKQQLYYQIRNKIKKDKSISITSMLKKFKLSKSEYYDYLRRKPCK